MTTKSLNKEITETLRVLRIWQGNKLKINAHKSMALVDTDNMMAETELVRKVPFKIAEKNTIPRDILCF